MSASDRAAVAAAALPLAGLLGVLLTWPLWRDRRRGPWFAPALLTLHAGAVVLAGVVATAAAGRTWQLLEDPDEQASAALLEVSRLDGDSSLYALLVLVLVAATALLGLLLSMAARFAVSDHAVDRWIACAVLGLVVAVSGVGLAYVLGGSRHPAALLAVAQLPLAMGAMAACWPAPAHTAPARTAPSGAARRRRPTGPGLVLVHGGATTGRFWDRLLPHLPGPALAPDLPGRRGRPGDLATLTVDEAAAAVVADVEAAGMEEVVLVAHSSGGLEVPAIVAGLGAHRVRAIILNAASVPPEGGCGLDCMQDRHREGSLAALEAARAAGTTITTPPPERDRLRRSSGEELDDDLLDFVADPERCVADSFNLYLTPVHWSRAAGVPVTYVVNLRDRAVPVDLQRAMAARVPQGAVEVELDAGHLAAVTRPEALARIISDAAAVGPTGRDRAERAFEPSS